MSEPSTDFEQQTEQSRARGKSIRNILLFVLGSLLLGSFLVTKFVLPPADFSGPAKGTVIVQIDPGDSVTTIANTLKRSGVISSVDRFIEVANNNPASTGIQSGRYKLGKEIPVALALAQLLDLKNKIFDGVIIPEGFRASEILTLLSTKTDISKSEFEIALQNPQSLGLPTWAEGQVEGFLFPALYEFPKTATAESILKTMIAKATSEYKAIGLPGLCSSPSACNGLTAHEVLVGASIMQAEVHPRDFNKVARVILNRLAEPMRLQMDSTVAYGRNKKQVMLSNEDLKTDTPYNTYLHDGLTPGPISNPGTEAVKAMLNPDSGDWLYFITVDLDTQETKFTRSYQEFLRYSDEFLSYCRSNPGKC